MNLLIVNEEENAMSSLDVFVSVIIPTYNDYERLLHCIEALEHQTLARNKYEIIVVDNCSSDNTHEKFKDREGLILIQEYKQSSYAARNAGIEVSKGEILAFTDSDCSPANDWLEKGILHLLKIPNCGFIGGNIKLFFKDPNNLTPVELHESVTGLPQERYVNEYNFAATANMFTWKSVIDKVGAFDSNLKSRGDYEWGRMVFKSGYNISFAEEVEVSHPARHSFQQIHQKSARVLSGIFDVKVKNNELNILSITKDLYRGFKLPSKKIKHVTSDSRIKTTKDKIIITYVVLIIHYIRFLITLKIYLKAAIRGV